MAQGLARFSARQLPLEGNVLTRTGCTQHCLDARVGAPSKDSNLVCSAALDGLEGVLQTGGNGNQRGGMAPWAGSAALPQRPRNLK